MPEQRSEIVIRLEDHPVHPGGWDSLPCDVGFTPGRDGLPPGTQSGTYFKSVRETDDGREIWTWGRVDPDTLAVGYVAGGDSRS